MKVGIIGAGGIAQKMAETLIQMDDLEAYAIASRSPERARAFAKQYGFEKAYDSYEDLVSDPEVDLVYIATPHSHHYEQAKLSLEHGKPVLCEKAFMSNAQQAKEIIALGRSKRLLVAEALWTRYMPSRTMINEIIAEGLIGKASSLTANLGYVVGHVKRLTDLSLAGGALLDLSVYPLNFAMMVFGEDFDSVAGEAFITETGVDAMNSITLKWRDGRMAVLHANMTALTDRLGAVFGDRGFLEVQNINNCEEIRVYNLERKLIKRIEVPQQLTGYEYQLEACRKAILAGEVECAEMPHRSIISVMETMDLLRERWGIRFPWE